MLSTIKQATVAVEYAKEALFSLDKVNNAAVTDLAQACADFLLVYSKPVPKAKERLQGADSLTE